METDAREIPLQHDPEDPRVKKQQEKIQAVADAYYACFTAHPDVLRDLQTRYSAPSVIVRVSGAVSVEESMGRAWQRDVVRYIVEQIQRGATGDAHTHNPLGP
jgi:hypothetical protein